MRICHVTPHLPPDQAANALLPWHLGRWAADRGDEVCYVSHRPRATGSAELPGRATWLDPPEHGTGLGRQLRLGTLAAARRYAAALRPLVADADLVHIHSNGLLAEVAGLVARRQGKATVLTLYGTEIWHYRRRRPIDLFTTLYRRAGHVTFYSQGLADRARELGLVRAAASVIYPPVAASFTRLDDRARLTLRRQLGLTARHVLLNVKRLHPLAGQRFLLEAMPAVLEREPDTQLVICGTGPLLEPLQAQAASLGIGSRLVFTGLVDNAHVARFCAAADLFVLPSLLEACPTVAVEALASGTPVLSADHPGGVELARLFGSDVQVVPRERADALADAILAWLGDKRRTDRRTAAIVADHFGPKAVAERYWSTYASLAGAAV
jgi:glycosyltransferase involved in cell wall biosynthesis